MRLEIEAWKKMDTNEQDDVLFALLSATYRIENGEDPEDVAEDTMLRWIAGNETEETHHPVVG